MTEREVKTIVQSLIAQSMQGLDKESPKLDFKKKWYPLKEERGLNEFLKDTTAIANTPGLDGFIVIGFDEKNKTFHSTTLKDSGLNDDNELVGVLMKHVDRPFVLNHFNIELEGAFLSVLHVPPSFDKPHVIRIYKTPAGHEERERIFIRNGSTARMATKYDHDFINYDRKNNLSEYSLIISAAKLGFNAYQGIGSVDLTAGLIFENNGLRPMAIYEIVLTLCQDDYRMSFISKTNKEEPYNTHIKVSNIIVRPGDIVKCTALHFSAIDRTNTSTIATLQTVIPYLTKATAKVSLNTNQTFDLPVILL
jgi:hypothetical protein